MIEGEIILAQLPQADGGTKLRPVLLLKELPGYKDFLVCGISTQLRQLIAGFDELIDQTTSNFSQTGLRQTSIIRLGFLAVIPNQKIAGSIGKIEAVLHRTLVQRLATYLLQ